MHKVSKAAKEAGGMVIGVVPRKIEEMGRLSPYLDVHIPTENLTDRKDLMMAQSDAFIVLPGGIGTLDELFTVVAAATLDYHHKPVVLYNQKSFWDALVALLDDLAAKGMMRKDWHTYIKTATTVEEVAAVLSREALLATESASATLSEGLQPSGDPGLRTGRVFRRSVPA